MRKRLVFALIVLMSTWLAGSAWADYVDSVVLIPNADGAFNTWTSPPDTDNWMCVNDSCGDAERCVNDTTEKLWAGGGIDQYRLTEAPPADTIYPCDSMAICVNFDEQKSGTSGSSKIMFGWRYKETGSWYYCLHQGGVDTVTVSGTDCVVYRHSWTKNPYYEEPYGIPWFWYAGYLDDHDATNALQPAFQIISIESGCLPACLVGMMDVWVVFYFTVIEGEPAGNPATKKKKTLGGIYEEEDFHIPRLADCDWLQ